MGRILDSKNELQKELIEINNKLSKLNFILNEKRRKFLMEYQAVIKKSLHRNVSFNLKMVLLNYDALFTLIPELGEKVQKQTPILKCLNPNIVS